MLIPLLQYYPHPPSTPNLHEEPTSHGPFGAGAGVGGSCAGGVGFADDHYRILCQTHTCLSCSLFVSEKKKQMPQPWNKILLAFDFRRGCLAHVCRCVVPCPTCCQFRNQLHSHCVLSGLSRYGQRQSSLLLQKQMMNKHIKLAKGQKLDQEYEVEGNMEANTGEAPQSVPLSFELPVELPDHGEPAQPNVITIGPRPLKVPVCKECIEQEKKIEKLEEKLEKDNEKAKDVQEQQREMVDKYDRKMENVIQKIKDRVFKKGQQYKEIVSHLKTKTGPEGPPGRPGIPGEDGAPGKVDNLDEKDAGVDLSVFLQPGNPGPQGPPGPRGIPVSRSEPLRSHPFLDKMCHIGTKGTPGSAGPPGRRRRPWACGT
eukprot:751289-Hanusia_phi.AAC.5